MAEHHLPATAPKASWLSRFWADMGRRVEHRGWVIWYLIFERGLKGLALVAGAVYLYLNTDTGFDPLVRKLVIQFNLNAGSGFIHRVVLDNLLRLAGISENTIFVIATGALIYGVIESSESIGLVLRRRWAEYLVVLATAFFIPLELREVMMHVTSPFRDASLLINIAVVIYLIRKKRLFILDEAPEDA